MYWKDAHNASSLTPLVSEKQDERSLVHIPGNMRGPPPWSGFITTVASHRPVRAPHPPQPWPWSASMSCRRTSCWRYSRTCPPATCCAAAGSAASGVTSLMSQPSGNARVCVRASSPRTGMSLWPTGRSSSFCAASAGTSYATHVPKVGCFPPFPEPQGLCTCHSHASWDISQTLIPIVSPRFLLILEFSIQRPALVHLKKVLSASIMSPPLSSFIALFRTCNYLFTCFFPLPQTSSSRGLMDLACLSLPSVQ